MVASVQSLVFFVTDGVEHVAGFADAAPDFFLAGVDYHLLLPFGGVSHAIGGSFGGGAKGKWAFRLIYILNIFY